MSTQDTRPSTKRPTTGVEPTGHAEFRYLERIDPEEPLPAARIREIVDEGVRAQFSVFDLPAYLKNGVAVLVDERTAEAVTVLEPSIDQFDGVESEPASGRADSCGANGCSTSDGLRQLRFEEGYQRVVCRQHELDLVARRCLT